MAERRQVPLADALTLLIDHRGRTPSKLGGSFEDTGVPVISAKCIRNGRVSEKDRRFVSWELFQKWMPEPLRAGDVLVTSEAPLGEVAWWDEDAPVCLGQRLFALRANPHVVQPRFLYYLMRSRGMRDQLRGRATGSTAEGIRQSQLRRVALQLPPMEQQIAAADLLGAIDDKIELNRRITGTIEDLSRTLFKSWFETFDPVRGTTHPPSWLRSLFPARLVESSIGLIPEGWAVVSVYDLASVAYGAPYASSMFNDQGEGRPLVRIRDLASHEPKVFTPETHPRDVQLDPGDVVVGMDGEFRAHVWRGPAAVLNQRLCKFRPKEGVSRGFVLFTIEGPLALYERAKSGTTVIHLGKADIDRFKVLKPPSEVMTAFSEIVDPLLDLLVSLSDESRTLATLRDTLLPELLSGELRLGAA